jgi:hypothetical protein
MNPEHEKRVQELSEAVLGRLQGLGIDPSNRELCEADLSQTVCAALCIRIYREHIYKGHMTNAL